MAGEALFCCSLAVVFSLVQAYYCDSDSCRDDEYCCGNNVCCVSYKVWELWYFWCGIMFFMFLVSICGCCWQYRRYPVAFKMGSSVSYSPLSTFPQEKMPSHQYKEGGMFGHDSYLMPASYPQTYCPGNLIREAPPPYTEATKAYSQ